MVENTFIPSCDNISKVINTANIFSLNKKNCYPVFSIVEKYYSSYNFNYIVKWKIICLPK